MPQTNRAILFLTAALCAAPALAQQPQLTATTSPAVKQPTTTDKLTRVRALIASRQLVLAGVELEQMKRENNDEAVLCVVRTMLAGVYLEQPAYERVKDLLDETLALSKKRAKSFDNSFFPEPGKSSKARKGHVNGSNSASICPTPICRRKPKPIWINGVSCWKQSLNKPNR